MKFPVYVLVFCLFVASVSAISVSTDSYRIETVEETSGWNSEGFVHVVEYTWDGASPVTRDVCMRTPVVLRSGSTAELYKVITTPYTTHVDVTGYDAMGAAAGCAREYNTWFRWNTSNGTVEKTYCYDRQEAIASGLRLFSDEAFVTTGFVDITDLFTHYVIGGKNYYCVADVTWEPGEVKRVRYRYRDDAFSSFKWDALFGDIGEQRVDLVLDPFTNATLYEADFTVDNASSVLVLNASTLSLQYRPANGISFWDLDNMNDLWGSNNLTNNGASQGANYPSYNLSGNSSPDSADFESTQSDYLNAGYSSSLIMGMSDFSVCAWVNFESMTGSTQRIVDYRDGSGGSTPFKGWNLVLIGGAGFRYTVDDNDYCYAETSSYSGTGSWVHVCGVIDRDDDIYIYKNGADATATTTWGGCADNVEGTAEPARIGESFDGKIDDVMVFDKALSLAEVQNIYNFGHPNTSKVFTSENMTASENVTSFTPVWTGNAMSINISFDGGTHYVSTTNNLTAAWNQTTKNVLQYQVVLNGSQTLSDFKIYLALGYANETAGRAAIIAGLDASAIAGSYTVYTDQQVYERLANGSQYLGTFDKFVVYGNKRWGFNYDENSSSGFPEMYNISPSFYVWQEYNMSAYAIESGVKALVNSTYGG